MSQKAWEPPNSAKDQTALESTAAYVKEMAHELSQLAKSAGFHRLSALLTLASLEAEITTNVDWSCSNAPRPWQTQPNCQREPDRSAAARYPTSPFRGRGR